MRRKGLTPRERQVAQALATRPEPYEELADFLGMGLATLKKHAGVVYEKLFIRGREELVFCWRCESFRAGVEGL